MCEVSENDKITRCGVVFFKEETPFNMSKILAIRHPLILKEGQLVSMWDFPKGGKHKNETPEEGARRELYEETGIIVEDFSQFKKFKLRKTFICMKKVDNIEEYSKFDIQDTKEVEEVKWMKIQELYHLEMTTLFKFLIGLLKGDHRLPMILAARACGAIIIKLRQNFDESQLLLIDGKLPQTTEIYEENIVDCVFNCVKEQTGIELDKNINKQQIKLMNKTYFFVIQAHDECIFSESKTIKCLKEEKDVDPFIKLFIQKYENKIEIKSKRLLR